MSNVRCVTLSGVDVAVLFCPNALSLGWLSLSRDSPMTNPVNRQPMEPKKKKKNSMFWNENHAPSWTTHSNYSP